MSDAEQKLREVTELENLQQKRFDLKIFGKSLSQFIITKARSSHAGEYYEVQKAKTKQQAKEVEETIRKKTAAEALEHAKSHAQSTSMNLTI